MFPWHLRRCPAPPREAPPPTSRDAYTPAHLAELGDDGVHLLLPLRVGGVLRLVCQLGHRVGEFLGRVLQAHDPAVGRVPGLEGGERPVRAVEQALQVVPAGVQPARLSVGDQLRAGRAEGRGEWEGVRWLKQQLSTRAPARTFTWRTHPIAAAAILCLSASR